VARTKTPKSYSYLDAPVAVSASDLRDLSAVAEPQTGRPDSIEVTGECPRCNHPVKYVIQQREWGLEEGGSGGTVVEKKSTTAATSTTAAGSMIQRIPIPDEIREALRKYFEEDGPGDRDVVLQCNCAQPHKGGDNGCGAWFGLQLHWQRNNGMVNVELDARTEPITELEIKAAIDREARAATQLTRLRAATSKWSAGLLALAALVPSFTLLTGVETVADLSESTKDRVGLLLILATLGILASAFLLLSVSTGPFRHTTAVDDPTEAREAEIRRAVKRWNIAVGLFVAGLLALVAATAIVWNADSQDPAKFKVTRNNESVECGTYAGTVASPPAVKVKKAEETVVVPLSQVKTLSFTTGC
jgi:hypothetical protein